SKKNHQGWTLDQAEPGLAGGVEMRARTPPAPVPARKGTTAQHQHQKSARAPPAHVSRESGVPQIAAKAQLSPRGYDFASLHSSPTPISTASGGSSGYAP